MASPSSGAVHNEKMGNEPQPTTKCGAQAAISICVPDHLTYNIDRFLGCNFQTSTDNYLRPPPGFAQAPSEAEAESQMLKRLHNFDARFGSSSKPLDH
ncbi:hypothetical protein V8C37DRAFT_376766 [Trichoderma ceciliae]